MNACCAGAKANGGAAGIRWFDTMIERCLEYATRMKASGRPIVGILCEFTPRELIMAGGGVPVCLCGGSAATIPAAEEHLPANLCPLIKSTYGFHLLRTNPFLEMADLIVAETTCDGKKKMYELMGESRPMMVLELPQRHRDEVCLKNWSDELHRFREFLERRWNTAITDEKLRGAIAAMNRERALRRRLAGLMRSERPPLTGRELLSLRSSISCIPEDLERYDEIYHDLANRGGREKPRARVLLTGVPTAHGAERVVELIEGAGGWIVCMENCTGIKPIDEDVDERVAERDPIGALAEKYFHLPCSVMTPNVDRMGLLRRLAAEYRVDCVVDLIWHACLTYDVESHRTRRVVEEELGLPYLRIETDYSTADSARIAVRVEAMLEIVQARKACAERRD